ncbi:c-type cytochrome [Massilia antarctica]|uniref:c-type cytochrome n=1 Tax=Massilia antarctica TaxID=2765360 RepID=UPI0006BB8CA9|nr:cytochrome c [Massilia sp. H27-R4]MCY0912202.1 cytochrome c [Massilia sp. H27-R4]CUI06307.1 Nitric-oxide reductase subunit C [Janthinobacterium sp. CG23_2]CUU30093.1 Nitric-oxide reductase subunit C [Janthinobacterium sp. CG23_2]
MNKRQARLFAIGSTVLATVAFLALTLDSHRQFGRLTNADKITAQVTRGKDVWHENNCINCHTVFGEGAYYAPDLTKITKLRGNAYLTAYMKDPSKFYDETRHRRLMPKQDISDTDIAALIAFLDWVSNVDNQGWPPRPILVTGATFPGTDAGAAATGAPAAARPATSDDNPIALGERLFRSAVPACTACHSTAPGVNLAGPSLAGLVARTTAVLASGGYHGKATDVEGYIRESVMTPSAHVVPGAMYSANGQSFMPDTYGKSLTPEQIAQLAAYLSSLK